MNILNSLIVIAGVLTMEGKVLPSQEILLIQEKPIKVIASGKTDVNGNFSISLNTDAQNLHLVAKVRHEGIATILHRKLEKADFGTKKSLNLRKTELIAVHCSLLLPEGGPRSMDVFADLLAVEGVNQDLQPYFRYVSASVANSYFYRFPTSAIEFTWWVKPGKIRIGGDYIPQDGISADGPPPGFAVTRVEMLPDCKVLNGTWMLGFELDVNIETHLELRVEEVEW
jgi:hypothetical protein